MSYNPEVHHRRSIRVPGYDYSQCGAYFVTICAARRECNFGEVVGDAVVLSSLGIIVREEWFHSAEIRREVVLFEDEFVVMPNHIHGIVRIVDVGATGAGNATPVGATGRSPLPSPRVRPNGPRSRSIGAMIAGYKCAVTVRARLELGLSGTQIWQRDYWEHIVRDSTDLERITIYIRSNPTSWALDALHSHTGGADRVGR